MYRKAKPNFLATLSAQKPSNLMPSMKPHGGVCAPQRRSLRAHRLTQPHTLSKPKICKIVKDIFGSSQNERTSFDFENKKDDNFLDKSVDRGDEITGSVLKIASRQDGNGNKCENHKDLNSSETKHEHKSCESGSISSVTLETTRTASQSLRKDGDESLISRCENFLQIPAHQSNGDAKCPEKNSSASFSGSSPPHSCSGAPSSRPPSSPDSSIGQAYPSLLADLNNSDAVFSKLLLDEFPLEMREFSPSSTLSMSSVASSVCTSESETILALDSGAMCEGSHGRPLQDNAFLDAACMNFDPDKVNDGQFDVLEGYSFLW